jgi:hypothetical protein
MKASQFDYRRYGFSVPLIALIAACALWAGYEADWGKPAPRPVVKPARQVPLKEIRLAPDFALLGPDQDLAATTARPLFNPARRPLQGAGQAGSAQGSGLPGGRFTLTGVSISDESRVALLRDAATSKTVRVEQSKEVNGVLVESVTPDKVTLKLGTEREEITLKIAPPPPPVAAAGAPKADQAAGKAAAAPAPPGMKPLAPLPAAAAEAPGVAKAAADIANADPITEADIAERAARVQARRNRQSAAGERVSK